MPPEYCSFGPDYSTHCKPWLDKNYPGFLKVEEDATAPAVQETDEAVGEYSCVHGITQYTSSAEVCDGDVRG